MTIITRIVNHRFFQLAVCGLVGYRFGDDWALAAGQGVDLLRIVLARMGPPSLPPGDPPSA